jgi:dTDP-glucose 4,6-dehydratase
VSTDEVYGHLEIDDEPFTEETPIDARSPYSASKAASDMLALSYRNTYKLDITVTRCCNNYGEHQHDEKLIPTIIRSIVSGNKIPVYGKGDNIREWIYVKDHAKAVIEVLHHFSRQRIYNLYGTERYRNLDLIKKIIDELVKIYPKHKRDSTEDYIQFVEDRKGHDFKYAMASIYDEVSALHKQESFSDALIKTINYYVSKYY